MLNNIREIILIISELEFSIVNQSYSSYYRSWIHACMHFNDFGSCYRVALHLENHWYMFCIWSHFPYLGIMSRDQGHGQQTFNFIGNKKVLHHWIENLKLKNVKNQYLRSNRLIKFCKVRG